MKWKKFIEKYFEVNIQGTAGDIKIFILNNYLSKVREDVVLWIETICAKEPILKKLWYPLGKNNLELMAKNKVAAANLEIHLRNMWINHRLNREETNVGFHKYLYKKIGRKEKNDTNKN